MENRPDTVESVPAEACLLIYDGNCRLCVGAKERLEHASVGDPGSDVRFVPYDSEEAKRVLGARYRPGRPDAAFFVSRTGQVREGLSAFIPLLPRLSGGRILLWLLGFHLVRQIAEWSYRAVARHRYRLLGKARSDHSRR